MNRAQLIRRKTAKTVAPTRRPRPRPRSSMRRDATRCDAMLLLVATFARPTATELCHPLCPELCVGPPDLTWTDDCRTGRIVLGKFAVCHVALGHGFSPSIGENIAVAMRRRGKDFRSMRQGESYVAQIRSEYRSLITRLAYPPDKLEWSWTEDSHYHPVIFTCLRWSSQFWWQSPSATFAITF